MGDLGKATIRAEEAYDSILPLTSVPDFAELSTEVISQLHLGLAASSAGTVIACSSAVEVLHFNGTTPTATIPYS